MPSASTRTIRAASKTARHLIGQYRSVVSHHGSSATRAPLLADLRRSLEILDGTAIHAGTTRHEVLSLLGPAPGRFDADTWLYPGSSMTEVYAVAFRGDVVGETSFRKILAS